MDGNKLEIKRALDLDEEDYKTVFPSIELIPSDVFNDLNSIFDQEKSVWDVCFKVEDKPIYCHKLILAIRSPYFQKVFENSKPNSNGEYIWISDTPYTIFKELVHFAYQPLLDEKFDVEQLNKLKAANEKYAITDLTDLVNKRLDIIQKKTKSEKESDSFMTSAAIQLQMSPGLNNFNYLSDVTISVDGITFKLHKVILMARCKFFEGMLSHNFKENKSNSITLDSMTADVFEKVVEYIYTGRIVDLPAQLCMDILVAANLLGLKRLTTICEKALQPLLDEDNVVAVCQGAEYHNANQLIEVCVHVMVRNYTVVSNQSEFAYLSEQTQKRTTEEREVFEKNYTDWKNKQVAISKVKKFVPYPGYM